MNTISLCAAVTLFIGLWCFVPNGQLGRLERLVSSEDYAKKRPAGSDVSQKMRVFGAAAFSLATMVVLPMPTAIACGIGAGVSSYWALGKIEGSATRHRREELMLQQPEVLDLLAAAQEAGAPLRTATSEVARLVPEPSSQLLVEVEAHLKAGFSESEAWGALANNKVWNDVARDLSRATRTGEAVGKTLHIHAGRARTQRRDHLTKKARTVGVRAVGPMMVCFLPAFILVGVVPIVAGVVGKFFG